MQTRMMLRRVVAAAAVACALVSCAHAQGVSTVSGVTFTGTTPTTAPDSTVTFTTATGLQLKCPSVGWLSIYEPCPKSGENPSHILGNTTRPFRWLQLETSDGTSYNQGLRWGASTYPGVTLGMSTGSSALVDVAHGAGSAPPTMSTRFASTGVQSLSVSFFDTGGDHYITLDTSQNAAANRTLTLDVNDANRTVSLSGDLTLASSLSIGNAGDAGVPLIKPASDSSFNVVQNAAGTPVVTVQTTTIPLLGMSDRAIGTGNVTGPRIGAGRNTSGSGAAGLLYLKEKDGTTQFFWPDDTGVLRISTSAPDEDGTPSDTSGTVVGAQTSMASTKVLLGRNTETADALALVLRTPVYRFTYRNGAYNGTVFQGITTDDSPEFGMDPDPSTGQMRSFNPLTAHGVTVLAIQELQKEIESLRTELQRLKARPRYGPK